MRRETLYSGTSGHVRQFDLDRVRQVLVRRVIGRDVEAHGVRAPDVHGFVRLGDSDTGDTPGVAARRRDGGQVVVALLVSADDPRELLCLLAGDVGRSTTLDCGRWWEPAIHPPADRAVL